MKKPLFTGSGVAIVTPFTKETVDLPTLGKLLDFHCFLYTSDAADE